MRLHIAGLCSGLTYKWYLRQQFTPRYILESFFYLKDWLFDLPFYRTDNFLLDSGAFTFLNQKKKAKPDWDLYVEKYAQAIVQKNIQFFFELDIDSIVGLAEVERLREKLERLTNRRCIPVWHRSRGKQYWLDMISEYDYVAVGGIVTKEIKQKVILKPKKKDGFDFMAINRDLDAAIAEEVFGWKLVQIGKDANGENACEILAENGELSPDYRPPNIGNLHRGFLTPQFSSNREDAIKAAVKAGLKMDISGIDFKDWQFPEKLSQRVLDFWREKQK